MKRFVDDFWKIAVRVCLLITLAFLIGPLIVAISMSFDARGYLAPFPPTSFGRPEGFLKDFGWRTTR